MSIKKENIYDALCHTLVNRAWTYTSTASTHLMWQTTHMLLQSCQICHITK